MDNREQFEAWHKSWIPQFDGELRYCDVDMQLFDAWQACAQQKDKEIAELKDALDACQVDYAGGLYELKELKQKINECWQLAYPESPPDDKDVAKMRIFNLYQDLKCTRDNLRFLSNAYNKMDAERKK